MGHAAGIKVSKILEIRISYLGGHRDGVITTTTRTLTMRSAPLDGPLWWRGWRWRAPALRVPVNALRLRGRAGERGLQLYGCP
jgi:hypothetical protein